ncbi:MAG: hypothetical protein J0I98_16480 [Mesorhizobium sp.]|nr:hypothetical protein [Mesorhizobium sp.]MBN9244384.1 hypothetical protein [Mesorhizobium sp.]
MLRTGLVSCLTAAALLGTAAYAAAATGDPDWPCQQRKVPQLSLGQVWNGPDLPKAAGDWSHDGTVSALVEDVAARRMPLDEARQRIRDFAAGLPQDQLEPKLTMLMQGLFDHMDEERSQVISGIGRYARKQIEMAASLRKESAVVDALRAKADADPDDVERQTDRLNFATRVYQERVQSLTYVCDVPTLIEQRLYQLAKTVAETLKPKK